LKKPILALVLVTLIVFLEGPVDATPIESNSDTGSIYQIITPYVTKGHEYKGQLHAHTTNSDGTDTPYALVTAYETAGYDFVAITDHNYLTPDPGVNGILHVSGVEETAESDHHVVSIGPTAEVNLHSIQSIIDAILADHAVPILAHPNVAKYGWTDDELERYTGYVAIEIYNALASPHANAEDRWDTILSRNMRSYGIAVDDCHHYGPSCNRGWVKVFADNLTSNAIIDALRNGDFYSSTGPTLCVSVSHNIITAETDSLGTIEWIGSGGETLRSTSNVVSDSYAAVGNEVYIRIRITRNSDHKNAWSNPLYPRGTQLTTSQTQSESHGFKSTTTSLGSSTQTGSLSSTLQDGTPWGQPSLFAVATIEAAALVGLVTLFVFAWRRRPEKD
jgi:hypothetical protein